MRLEHGAWREEVVDFLDKELPDSEAFDTEFCEDEDRWSFAWEFTKRLGDKGWIGLTWPQEYGGLARTQTEKFILLEELGRRDAPFINMIGWGLAAGTLLVGGSEEQKQKFLPPIGRMETFWGEGLSEPEAGSDLASLRTSAVWDDGSWVLNGDKTYTTWGNRADVLYLAARTDPDVASHRGLSVFCVATDLPGVTISPLWNMGGGRQNQFHFDHVRIPAEMLLGEVNKAWRYIMAAFYSSGPTYLPHALYERKYRLLDEYCRRTRRNGRLLIDHGSVTAQLSDLVVIIEVERVLAYARLSAADRGDVATSDPTMQAVVTKENRLRFAEITNEIMGPFNQLLANSPWAPVDGDIPLWYLRSFGNHAGGTSQVKRMQLATRGLGMPR
jgi:alkylation response protein AidB-like acyl-CoA dehydrogenase